ncbi:ketoacyl-synt-domain-containing protein [Polyplosphaeria fusca]|uniref:Ketoacyl-synt-domain-containing protein n=1 Tax=Polyplosphaeria fusca TaxID=682080 RepID=A0A9P4QM78_9PLEO|nr:ketoacyl-synt-domain-containing protein [Polyplosphaeria fusca]
MEKSSVPIAIVGMSCRFAGGASDPEKLWQLCAEGRTGWSEVPSDRFNIEGHYHPRPDNLNTTNVKGACFLDDDIGLFDAAFFNLPAETAACLDPQFRLMLESTYEAFENAGLTMKQINGSNTSVYAGSFFKDYHDAGLRDVTTLPRFFLIGVGSAMASNRLSHYFDLRGASMSIDTGCSTTLTALHQACNDLRNNESSMSVVSGANLMLNPDMFITMSSIALISKDGRSFAFDSRANGYGRGEGVATIVLKRLDDALRDGDPIQAVIKETALNQDGKTDTITTPSQEAQIALIRRVYKKAGLDPKDTGYFEAHGTGTPTGDPLEVGAIGAVFKDTRPSDRPLPIGSIKPNVGHTECASGLASIVKVVKALEKGQIPPAANLETVNPKLKLGEWNLKVIHPFKSSSRHPWPAHLPLRRASVNNFGYGGANSHVILEHYTQSDRATIDATLPSKVFMLSAKDENAAKALVSNLRDHLGDVACGDDQTYFNDLAYTLGERRSVFPWVASTAASSVSDLIRVIDSGRVKPRRTNGTPRLGFVFTGQGAQWAAMGRELISAYPVFRNTLLEAACYLGEFGADYDLLEELHRDDQTTRVHEAALGQPVCVAVQIALVDLLDSFGIRPAAVTSHSSGEIASAYAAGALSLRNAMGVVYARGSLAADVARYSTLGAGGMIAVGLGVEAAEGYIARVTSGKVVVACRNSPTSVTVSGDLEGVDELEGILKEDKVFARKLKVPTGYHSHHMQPIAEPYAAWMRENVTPEPRLHDGIIYSSPTTGQRMTSAEDIASPEHWVKSLTHPVLFVESFTNMCFASREEPCEIDMVVEIGAHAALSGPIQDIMMLDVFKGSKIAYSNCLTRKKDAVATMQALATEVLHNGYQLDMAGVNLSRNGRVLTDLPKYAWNHSSRHWYEPRTNRAHRMLSEGPHDLLGSVVVGSNRINPSWRHIIKPSSMPWITDHKLQGTVVYPGAGFICMAIEGLAQAEKASSDKVVQSYQLRDIDILQALVIPEGEDGVEVQLSLRPCGDRVMAGWREFQVFSVTHDDKWSEHCRGLISIRYDSAIKALPAPLPDAADYRVRVSPSDVYASMHRVGIQHGPVFQNIKSVRARAQASLSTIEIVDTAAVMPYQFEHSHIIHPTTLDNIIQTVYGALPAAGANMTSAQVPRSLKRLEISSQISSLPGSTFTTFSSVRDNDKQGFWAGITVVDEKQNVVVTMEDFAFQSIGSALSGGELCANDKFLSSKWVPDWDLASTAQLKQQLASEPSPIDETDGLGDLKPVCTWFIEDALATLTRSDIENLQGPLKRYYVWMKQQANRQNDGDVTSPEEKEALIAKARTETPHGELLCNIGSNLADMCRGKVSPLDLMDENLLLYRFYAEGLKLDRSRHQMAELVRLFGHKNPQAKILEVGAGSGAATHHILNALGAESPLAASYDYTDVSEDFFAAAKEEFQTWQNLLTFQKLDIEQDPAKQGFETGTYDLVLASRVLNKTGATDDTMSNVRKLLKPSGTLLFMAPTKDQLDFRMMFGLLPDQWLGEEENCLTTPILPVDAWDTALRRSDFTGVELDVHESESEELYSYSVIKASAVASAPVFNPEVVIATPECLPPQPWVDELCNSIASVVGALPTIQPCSDELDCEGKLVVFLGELSAPILNNPSEQQFQAIRDMVTKSKGLLWVTHGGALESENPLSSLSQGFMRILRLEYVGKRLGTLDLDPESDCWSASSVSAIGRVFSSLFADLQRTNEPKDFEFAERKGCVHVLRYFKDNERNKTWFPDASDAASTSLQPFGSNSSPLRLTIENPGHLDSLVFVPVSLPTNHSEEVEVIPKAFGISVRDVNAATAALQDRHMGFECAGVISQVGELASSQGFKAGDRVAVLTQGDCSNVVRSPWTSVMRIPDDMSFELAAALPMAYATAWISLMRSARLEKGESILIHDAGSAVGQAAIALAAFVGAEIFATVSSFEHGSFLRRVLGIPADHIFPSDNAAAFSSAVLSKTKGRGVDVVLNTLEGPLLQESLNCVAAFGRFIELGKKNSQQNTRLDLGAFSRGISIFAVDVAMLAAHKGHQVKEALASVFDLIQKRAIQGVFTFVHDISHVVQAFRNAQSTTSAGKVVLSVNQDSAVPVIRQTPTARLHADASYVVVGGFGGIGQSVCLWLAEHGARNLIVLSRSANASERATALLGELGKLQCRVKAISCDIADEADLQRAVESCNTDMPPVRGLIQGAMALRDSILEQMSLSDYTTGLRPKVQGTWNLHKAFSSAPVDFFVILSSIAGVIGIASQCNYGAGGAFQDALAAYRTSHGMPCVSIDIGAVKNVGYVAEHDETNTYLKKQGHMLLSESDVLKAVECAITSPYATQLIFGINTSPNSALWDDGPASRDLRFSPAKYRSAGEDAANAGPKSDELAARISRARTLDDAVAAVAAEITAKIMDIFMIPEEEVFPNKPMADFGVDSLTAVELRNALATKAAAEISIFDIMQSPSLDALAAAIAVKSAHISPALAKAL